MQKKLIWTISQSLSKTLEPSTHGLGKCNTTLTFLTKSFLTETQHQENTAPYTAAQAYLYLYVVFSYLNHSVLSILDLGDSDRHVLDVSLFQHTRFKRSARHRALLKPDNEPFIWIRCVGAGRHQKARRTGGLFDILLLPRCCFFFLNLIFFFLLSFVKSPPVHRCWETAFCFASGACVCCSTSCVHVVSISNIWAKLKMRSASNETRRVTWRCRAIFLRQPMRSCCLRS